MCVKSLKEMMIPPIVVLR